MTQIAADSVTPEDILAFWFPPGLQDKGLKEHDDFWASRMRGGMDQAICTTMAQVTESGARGAYDHWAETAYGRLALLLVLDQFPRSLWRDTPAAFGQDIKANLLILQGIENGHYDALDWPWEKNFYIISLCHCEGPDHLARMEMAVAMADALTATVEGPYAARYAEMGQQPRRVREVIRRFGRHPHRNPFYGRLSSPEEEAYIAAGEFPHVRKIGSDAE